MSLWTVREVVGNADRVNLRDRSFDTKRQALAHIRSLNTGEKPTIGRFGHTYVVQVKS